AVNKPAGLLSQPGRLKENHDSLFTRLQSRYTNPYLTHRLDLDTSGLMLIALNKAAAGELGKLFERRQISKHYIALVDGLVGADNGVIELPLIADWPNRPLQKVCFETGKTAKTEYQVLERLKAKQRTRLKLMPHTGRSHQLRVHCAEIGHPIIGCDMYAPDAVCYGGERLYLHAEGLSFVHPFTNEPLTLVSPTPF
ncbi:MAG: pseudouridine synthase, partial [Gammaproteobacteria bacterium]|nr:pseudouridine synthase [Gammaproteobacteria bacterium]